NVFRPLRRSHRVRCGGHVDPRHDSAVLAWGMKPTPRSATGPRYIGHLEHRGDAIGFTPIRGAVPGTAPQFINPTMETMKVALTIRLALVAALATMSGACAAGRTVGLASEPVAAADAPDPRTPEEIERDSLVAM